MYASKDMRLFLNSFGSPNYFERDVTYLPEHRKKEDLINYEFKYYYKNSGRYFMGVGAFNLVREINSQDFNRVKKLSLEVKKRTENFIQGSLF